MKRFKVEVPGAGWIWVYSEEDVKQSLDTFRNLILNDNVVSKNYIEIQHFQNKLNDLLSEVSAP